MAGEPCTVNGTTGEPVLFRALRLASEHRRAFGPDARHAVRPGTMDPRLRSALSLLVVAALGGCAPTPVGTDAGPAETDAPPVVDAGPPPPPYTCDGDVTVVDGVLGTTASLTLDIAMTPERPRDLGP